MGTVRSIPATFCMEILCSTMFYRVLLCSTITVLYVPATFCKEILRSTIDVILCSSLFYCNTPQLYGSSDIHNPRYGGEEAGTGLADVLWGKVNPSARLSITIYKQKWADVMNCKNFTEGPGQPRVYVKSLCSTESRYYFGTYLVSAFLLCVHESLMRRGFSRAYCCS